MKQLLAFVLGIALASGVAYVVVEKRQTQRPAQVAGPTATFSSPADPVQAEAKPAPDATTQQNTDVEGQTTTAEASKALPPVTGEAVQDAGKSSRPPGASHRRSALGSAADTRSRANERVIEQDTTAVARSREGNTAPVQVAQASAPAAPQFPNGNVSAQDPNWRHDEPASSPVVQQPPAITPPHPVMDSGPAPYDRPAPHRAPAPREPNTVTIPAGTTVTIRLEEPLSTDRSFQGDAFRASLVQPLVVDGFVLAERGARAFGKITELDKGGRVRGTAHMTLELTSLNTSDGQKLHLRTGPFQKQSANDHVKDAAKVGGGAAIGAIIGAIAGGGKGAGIGAIVGGAAGGADVAMTRGQSASLPVESRITFRLSEPITITERLD